MPKDIPISNGNLLINFDFDYQIRDVYYPLVGQENHSKGLPFRFGVWVDGQFSWMGPQWEKDLRYRDDSVVTDVRLKNETLGVELRCSDAVDVDLDVYIKRVEVEDLQGYERQVKLFFSHDFHLYGNDIGDTAYFDPRTHCIIHYKANRYFLINCSTADRWGVDHFTCGSKETQGKPSTWEDAEDGMLARYPYAWGSADSTVGIWLHLYALGKAVAYYCIVAGKQYVEVVKTNEILREKTPDILMNRTSGFWEAWIQNEPRSFADLPKPVSDIFNRSLLILRTQVDNRGAIIAANDSDIVRFGRDTYSYMWGRDGAYVAVALAESGHQRVCRKFFQFVSRILSEEGYLFQHYNPDGSVASIWHSWIYNGREVLPIQEDSTALVLWAFWKYFELFRDIEFVRPLYQNMILKMADFLLSHRDPETRLPLPSYDLWEERFGIHTFTCSAVIAGLRAAARFARLFKDDRLADRYETALYEMKEGICIYLYHDGLKRYARSGYRKGMTYEPDEVIDISLLGLVTLGEFDPRDPRVAETAEAVRKELWVDSPIGGCARYRNDRYYRQEGCPEDIPGNPWFISTLWLAEYFILRAGNKAELREAIPFLEWCAKNALPSGVLAEQVDPVTGSPLSVSPLTWSHSAYALAVLEYIKKFDSLT
jgi:GH15 family glucan-1,4-alpha-glucosidase